MLAGNPPVSMKRAVDGAHVRIQALLVVDALLGYRFRRNNTPK